MDKQRIRLIIKIASQAGELKQVLRTGWVLKGVEDAESVADHTWRMSLLIMLLASEKLDKLKMLEMNTVHDLGEIGVGDTKWEIGRRVVGSQEAKRSDEFKVMGEIFEGYEGRNKYLDLLKEFNDHQTPEARFLKQLDKLDMALQALEYQQSGYPADWFDEFWENAEKYLEGRDLEPYFKDLERMREELGTNK